MKKYRLIKEYPGGPELGFISKPHNSVDKCENNHYWCGQWFNPRKFPEHWEEIIEIPEYVKCISKIGYCKLGGIFATRPKLNSFEWYYNDYNSKKLPDFCDGGEKNWDYSGVVDGFFIPATKEEYENQNKDWEILSFMWNDELSTLRDNGRYVYDKLEPKDCPDEKGATLKQMFDEYDFPGCQIYSVKRKIDGEIFTIGDKVRINCNRETVVQNIIGFKIEHNLMWILTNNSLGKLESTINNYCKSSPLFITEDGVQIFEGDKVYIVAKNTFLYLGETERLYNAIGSYLCFSTEEAAQYYIDNNKPMYSKQDVLNMFSNIGNSKDVANVHIKYLKHK